MTRKKHAIPERTSAEIVSRAVNASATDFDRLAAQYRLQGDATEARHWERWAQVARIVSTAIYTEAQK